MELLFKNLLELNEYFDSENKCWEYLENLRWGNNPVCPFCKSEKHYKLSQPHTYKCKDCKKRFNAKIGTIFDNTKIPLKKWFIAIYIATSHKKGISSCQLSKDISVTQKTAWFILHRIREMLKIKAPRMLDDIVEVDETYVGGSISNKHKSQRQKYKDRPNQNKSMVFTILGRNTYVKTKVVKDTENKTLEPIIIKRVGKNATIVSDAFASYNYLHLFYKKHEVVNHQKDEWVKGDLHTNTVEGFFSQLKRGVYGIYHHVSPKHLHRYCKEFEYRYNTRKIKEVERFNHSLSICNKRLKYKDLIRKAV